MTKLSPILAGTSGYSFPAWVGGFYPAGTKPAVMLPHYASKLPAVELNNTFYRLPKIADIERWREQVGQDFRFAVKASRRISHFTRLGDNPDAIEFLQRSLSSFGPQLGAVLLQLPPHMRREDERLKRFLAQWGTGLPLAMEFRHPSWFDDTVFSVLTEHQVAVVHADGGKVPLPELMPVTANFAYARLRREEYGPEQLEEWVRRLQSKKTQCVFAFFKHEERGPDYARELCRLSRNTA